MTLLIMTLLIFFKINKILNFFFTNFFSEEINSIFSKFSFQDYGNVYAENINIFHNDLLILFGFILTYLFYIMVKLVVSFNKLNNFTLKKNYEFLYFSEPYLACSFFRTNAIKYVFKSILENNFYFQPICFVYNYKMLWKPIIAEIIWDIKRGDRIYYVWGGFAVLKKMSFAISLAVMVDKICRFFFKFLFISHNNIKQELKNYKSFLPVSFIFFIKIWKKIIKIWKKIINIHIRAVLMFLKGEVTFSSMVKNPRQFIIKELPVFKLLLEKEIFLTNAFFKNSINFFLSFKFYPIFLFYFIDFDNLISLIFFYYIVTTQYFLDENQISYCDCKYFTTDFFFQKKKYLSRNRKFPFVIIKKGWLIEKFLFKVFFLPNAKIRVFISWLFFPKKLPVTQFCDNKTLEIIWASLPAAVLILLIMLPSFSLLYFLDQRIPYEGSIKNDILTIKIIGRQWYWDYECISFDPITKEITDSFFSSYMMPEDDLFLGELRLLQVDNLLLLPKFKTVRLLITSGDVIHSWSVPSLGIKCDACPGRLNQVWTYLNKSGIFYGQCSEICGANHPFMPIMVKVV